MFRVPNIADSVALRQVLQRIKVVLDDLRQQISNKTSYDDEDARDAINTDSDHGQTAPHDFGTF